MKEIPEFEIRKQTYLLVVKQPGLHLSKIAELLEISIPLALYHLRYLEKTELLTSSKEDGYLRYYAKGEIGTQDKIYLSFFRQEMLLKIVLFLLKNPYSRHKEIVDNFEISRSLLSYYLSKLTKKGIIIVQEEGKEHRYIVVNEEVIIRFLIKYEPYKMLKGLSDTWVDFTMR
jgi:predicted transcriptional regulator